MTFELKLSIQAPLRFSDESFEYLYTEPPPPSSFLVNVIYSGYSGSPCTYDYEEGSIIDLGEDPQIKINEVLIDSENIAPYLSREVLGELEIACEEHFFAYLDWIIEELEPSK